MRARRLRVAASGARGREHRLIVTDGKELCEFRAGDNAARRHFHRDAVQRFAGRIEIRLERHCRLVVEQDDQLLADVDERDFFVRDAGDIRLYAAVVAQRHDDRLFAVRLGDLDDALRFSGGRRGAR